MKLNFDSCRRGLLLACLLTSLTFTAHADEPKKVLVITCTEGFPHSSVVIAEKILTKIGEDSKSFIVADVVRSGPRPKGEEEQKAWVEKMRSELADKMSATAIKKYDAIIFANTTGNLPLPDKQAFLDYIKSGKGFIGMHSASDTFHGQGATVDPYIEMLGGEFKGHDRQVGVECLVQDMNHPATQLNGSKNPKDKDQSFCIEREEIYQFKNYDPKNVHELLILDKHPTDKTKPGHFAVSWCKNYGNGKVFYTSLGHNEAVWENKIYQRHILGGIQWALGLAPGDATPQAK
jgi:type 1 glutamine amidotransferase